MQIKSELETITPSQAKQMLQSNTGNRNIRKRSVEIYAKQMKLGNWRVTGEPICFDTKGCLINGQHRLMACIEADVSIDTFVIRNMDRDTMKVMDTGATRSNSDMFAFEGIQNGSGLGASIRIFLAMKSENGPHGSALGLITRDEIFDEFQAHPAMWQSCVVAGNRIAKATGRALPQANLGAFLADLHANNIPEPKINEFIEKLEFGAGMTKTDPVLAYRQFMLRGIERKRATSRQVHAANLIRVWNYSQTNHQVNRFIGWTPKTDFPTLTQC